jgi:hypothetical protein
VRSILEHDGGVTDVVVTISNPRLEGQNLTYDVKTLEGDLPKAGGAAALFIDVIVVRRAPVRPTVVVEARHAALRSLSHSSMKAENRFQLRVLGVTTKNPRTSRGFVSVGRGRRADRAFVFATLLFSMVCGKPAELWIGVSNSSTGLREYFALSPFSS